MCLCSLKGRHDPTFICATEENLLREDLGEEWDAGMKGYLPSSSSLPHKWSVGRKVHISGPYLVPILYNPLRWLGMKVNFCITTETKNHIERDMF